MAVDPALTARMPVVKAINSPSMRIPRNPPHGTHSAWPKQKLLPQNGSKINAASMEGRMGFIYARLLHRTSYLA
jgi:hypothetical protein